MISALSWIPKGANRSKPIRFELSSEEIERIEHLANEEEEIEREANSHRNDEIEDSDDVSNVEIKQAEGEVDGFGLPAELKMEQYDEEEDIRDILELDDGDESNDEGEDEMEIIEEGNSAFAFDAPDELDEEDDEIRPTDSILLLAMTEDEYSHLEIQVLTAEGSLYTHHDIMLPDFPLCLAWLDCPPFVTPTGQQQTVGSYVAVGTFDPAIEIWNLDVLDPVEPSAVLGGEDATKLKKSSKKSKGSAKAQFKDGSHLSSVMSLSWNNIYRQALASGSADKAVKIWDVTTQCCSYTFTHHQDKVNSVSWHPSEAWLLSTASFDKTLALIDCRTAAITKGCNLPSDIECLAWDPFQSYHLYAALENGQVLCLDLRNIERAKNQSSASGKESNPFLSFFAHDKTVSSIQFSSSVKGMMATASLDQTVKIWDVNSLQDCESHLLLSQNSIPKKISKSSQGAIIPKCVAYKTMNVGKLFTMRFSSDDPFTLATAGDEGKVAIWESDENEVISHHFQNAIYEINNPYLLLQRQHVEEEPLMNHAKFENDQYTFLPLPMKEKISLDIRNDYLESLPQSSSLTVDEEWMNDDSGIANGRSLGTDKKKKKKKKQ